MSVLTARIGFTPAAANGVRMALRPGRGATAAPVAAAMVSVVLAVGATAASLCFVASLDRLVTTPRLYGWNWDLHVGGPFAPDVAAEAVPQLERLDGIAGLAVGVAESVEIEVNGVATGALAVDAVKGDVGPLITEGRRPDAFDEIALAQRTMRDARTRVGGDVEVRVGAATAKMRVVGRTVLPSIVDDRSGAGAALTFEGYRRLAPDATRNSYLIGVATGFTPNEVSDALLTTPLGGFDSAAPERSDELLNFTRIDALPAILAIVVLAVAVASLIHALVASVRWRRRELAVLKTLGFVPRQLMATVAWLATTVAVVGLVVGLPVGIAVGRASWGVVADQLGVVRVAVVPMLGVVALVPALVVLANLVASGPGVVAARTPAATALRTE